MHKTNQSAGRLLGTILLDGSFVSPDHLGKAIEQQRKTSAQLGSILVGMGAISEADLEAVLSVQREFASPDDTIKAAAGVRELLGELLVRVKRLTPAALAEVLVEQERTGEKLGILLVRKGVISGSELDAVLAFQRRQCAPKSPRSCLRLGEVLVRSRLISRKKVEEALRRQKLSRKKIGEVLVECGYLRPDQLQQGLCIQRRLLTAALVAALSFASVLPARAFDLPAARAGAKAQFNIATIVKMRPDAKTLRQAHKPAAPVADSNRGYASIPAVLPADPPSR